MRLPSWDELRKNEEQLSVLEYPLDQPLKLPANADQPCPSLLQADERAVVMAFSSPETCAVSVDCYQGHEHEVGFDHRMAHGRLHDPERTRFERITCQETERLGRVFKAGIGDDGADCTGFLRRGERTDLAAERTIAADHGYARE